MILKLLGRILMGLFVVAFIYVLTLFSPQPFFSHKLKVGFVTVYSDEPIPADEMTAIVQTAVGRVEKSVLFKKGVSQNIFIANSPVLWTYFSSINYKAGGLNYVCFNHNIFLRRTDIKDNRLIGYSGKAAGGDRTLDYFMAHEMTHTFEFLSMPWYKYPLHTTWVLEGYCDYVAHGSLSYDEYLNHYLTVPENGMAKYYSRARTIVAYMLEKQKIDIHAIWTKEGDYDSLLKKAIPSDRPNIVN